MAASTTSNANPNAPPGPPAPPVRLCVDRNRRNGPSGFSLAPRSDAIYVTLSLWDGGDIGFMPLAVASEPVGSQ